MLPTHTHTQQISVLFDGCDIRDWVKMSPLHQNLTTKKRFNVSFRMYSAHFSVVFQTNFRALAHAHAYYTLWSST